MALKADRDIYITDISYFVTSITGPNSTRMERGGCLSAVVQTPGSGAAMDTSAQAAYYATDASGAQPLGVLLNDFVNLDLSTQMLNPYKDEQQIGTKALFGKKGWVVTNRVEVNAATGSMPTPAYLGPSGTFTTINRNIGTSTAYPVVGRFLSRIDSDGYAKVSVDLA
jgi:hypothetical protein